ncbi:phosphatase PAP2 family protein [Ramlibacter humi]|uniref:Phosphatase PAP2 family protein n=1 Tax=Ramlibacter humi TaxID=2530451 RepID=A0A4Z0CBE7_9BURK|nr:phosphatase PAP2 family protein [Ramlibacter humi]TFZ08661.1 phosphatase PAP2 family protein [Ramlibacter humi]
MLRQTLPPLLVPTVAALVLVLGWDASGLDLPAAQWASHAGGFPLRDNWLWSKVLHEGARTAVWLMVLWPVSALWRPTGVLRRLPRARIGWLLATALTGMLLISVLKHHSLTSCPWDLREFGGKARLVSHWAWGLSDGGSGQCFPGGHASAGFAWLAGYFAFREHQPRVARAWLAGALVAGAAMGVAQQLRGAHFASHTLWTAWLCWTWAWLCSFVLPALHRDETAAR